VRGMAGGAVMSEPICPAELERIERNAEHHGFSPDASKLIAEIRRLRTALEKIDAIRNDIIGRQSVNWSGHIYPLVAALGEAGFEGAGYEIAREKAKQEIDWLRANPDRAAAYALVERETREAGLSIMVGPCNAIESFGAVSDQQEIGTLLEAVDKLRGDGRGENENG
jgi:hypothetical protein